MKSILMKIRGDKKPFLILISIFLIFIFIFVLLNSKFFNKLFANLEESNNLATNDYTYIINDDLGIVYTRVDTEINTIKSKLSDYYDKFEIENNKLKILDNGNIIKEYKILNISSDYYDLNKAYTNNSYYIYTKTEDLDISKITLSDELEIRQKENSDINDRNNICLKDSDICFETIYNVKIKENIYEYKIIDNFVYYGIVDIKDFDNRLNISYGYSKMNNNKILIYDNNETLLDTFNFLYVDLRKEKYYDYSLNENLLYLGTTFLDEDRLTPVNCSVNYLEDKNILEISFGEKIIEEIKIINLYVPSKYNFFENEIDNSLYLKVNENIDEIIVNNVTNINDINKDKINIINSELKEDGDGDYYFGGEEWRGAYLWVYKLKSKNYDLSKEYIYLGNKEFNNDFVLYIEDDEEDFDEWFGLKLLENSIEVWDRVDSDDFKYKAYEWKFIRVTSEEYDLSSDIIDLKNTEIDLSKIKVVNAKLKVENNKLLVMYGDEVAKEFKLKNPKVTTTTKKETTTSNRIKDTTTTKKSTTKINESTTTNTTVVTTNKNIKNNNKDSSKKMCYGINLIILFIILINLLLLLYVIKLIIEKKKSNLYN